MEEGNGISWPAKSINHTLWNIVRWFLHVPIVVISKEFYTFQVVTQFGYKLRASTKWPNLLIKINMPSILYFWPNIFSDIISLIKDTFPYNKVGRFNFIFHENLFFMCISITILTSLLSHSLRIYQPYLTKKALVTLEIFLKLNPSSYFGVNILSQNNTPRSFTFRYSYYSFWKNYN